MSDVCAGVVSRLPAQEARCKRTCPAGVDIPRYVRLISQGKFEQALAVIRERNPFPWICSYVCRHPCEDECILAEVDSPVAINALERFVCEHPECYGLAPGTQSIIPMKPAEAAIAAVVPTAKPTGKRVAIVGSGPAGLTAAYYLARLGHAITVFEALSEPGGLMRVGIPSYRLPKEVLNKEINAIRDLGVEIKTNSRVKSLEGLFEQGYDAIFLAVGAHRSAKMGIGGEDSPGVLDCMSFLRDVNLGREVQVGHRIAVVGGGNAAIDGARCSLRLGAEEVLMLYRRTRTEMPANADEVEAALKEGVRVQFLVAPTKIRKEDGVLKVECIRMKLGPLDASRRPRPEPIAGSEFVMDFDTIIAAIGEMPDIPQNFRLPLGEGGVLQVDSNNSVTGREGIFGGGDAVIGPASAIEAIASGRRAANSIDKYLGGQGIIDEPLAPQEEEPPILMQGLPIGERATMPTRAIEERVCSFSVIELGFDGETTIAEAKRCLRCDMPIRIDARKCVGCLTCAIRCTLRFEKAFNPMKAKLKVTTLFEEYNDISFTNECDDCGLCARYCPYYALVRGKR